MNTIMLTVMGSEANRVDVTPFGDVGSRFTPGRTWVHVASDDGESFRIRWDPDALPRIGARLRYELREEGEKDT